MINKNRNPEKVNKLAVGSTATPADGDLLVSGNVGVGGSPSGDDLITVGDGTATNGKGIRIYSQRPMLRLFEQDTTNQNWQIESDAGVFKISTQNDAFTSVSNKLTIANSGLATFSNGIAFTQTGTSATGAATTSSTLDHYEEGTWTPVLNGVTGASVTGYYTRIGKQVHISYYSGAITTTAVAALITGLPFNAGSYQAFTSAHNTWTPAATTGYFSTAAATLTFTEPGATGTAVATAASARYIILSGTYSI